MQKTKDSENISHIAFYLLFFESKQQVRCLKQRKIKEAKNVCFDLKKKTYQRWKTHYSNEFCRKSSRTIAPEENCPPTPKLTLTQPLTLTGGQFSSGAIVWLSPNPKTNPNLDPSPNPKRGQFSSGVNCPDTIRKSDVSENTKVYYGQFLWNGLHERNCYINKCRWDVQDLGKCASFGREIKVGLDGQRFCWVCLAMSIRLLRACFINGHTSKGAFLLVMLDRRFHIKVLGNDFKKLWAVEHHCVVYHLSLFNT